MHPPLILYSYWRSSAAYRVRLALALKGLPYELRPVHLVADGGQHHQPSYRALNPQGLVPTLIHGDLALSQSLAIMEYLDESFPQSPLLAGSAGERARARMMAQLIACDIHPLNNLRVLSYLVDVGGFDDQARVAWYRHWTETGLNALEALLQQHRHPFCSGEEPGLADCCLLPQVYNARRFSCSLDGLQRVQSIAERLDKLPQLEPAAPENQPDAG